MLLLAAIVTIVGLAKHETKVEASAAVEPSVLEHVEGEEFSRILLTAEAADRTGIRTTRVRASTGGTVVPYAALIYDPHGETWVYRSVKPLVYLRTPVEVERIEGAFAYLSDGPPKGTRIVSVGSAELYGTEFDIGH